MFMPISIRKTVIGEGAAQSYLYPLLCCYNKTKLKWFYMVIAVGISVSAGLRAARFLRLTDTPAQPVVMRA